MNIDFDSLRDPDAPRPGAREREGVHARARRLRARSRLNRLALSSVSVVAVVALVLGIVASQRDNGPHVTVEQTSTPASSVADRFVPPTSTEDGITTVPVTLPDGETTTLTYPSSLRVAQLGFAGGIGINWPVDTGDPHCCGRQVRITYDTVEHAYGNATPIKTYRGVNGEAVPFFHSPTNAALDYLVFQFGPWLVQVYDVAHTGDHEIRMTDDQRATWARSLSATLDDNGYLLLHAAPPLSIGKDFDGLFGAPVASANTVELAAHLYCGQPESDSSTHRRSVSGGTLAVSWCVGDDLHVSASGSENFVDLADHSLQVSDLTPAVTTATTTTTLPAAPASPAVSASFVSPDHGWVLQRNGDVAETTDGGATWHKVGNVRLAPSASQKIRFADAAHGFAFSYVPNGGAAVWSTTDGGADWTRMDTPFTNVFDLAVSNRTVYVVAEGAGKDVTWRIWSSPADGIAWSEDPIVMRPGAGPIITFAFTFSGERGWLLEDDRGTVDAAELTSRGWSSWRSPCAGSMSLTASAANELAATCVLGVWTGPRITNEVLFSHDGGNTFTHHDAPGAGPIASPEARTAVIATGDTLQRTTDEGSTWQVVARLNDLNAFPDELGFTTATQGFAIFRNGTMLMTHDAGATWQKVTFP